MAWETTGSRRGARVSGYGGHLEDRGKSYRVTIKVAGTRHDFRLAKKEYTEKEARQWAARKHLALERDEEKRSAEARGTLFLSSLIQRFRVEHVSRLKPNSRRPYEALFWGLDTFFVQGERGDLPVSALTTGRVKEYLAWRRTHPVPRAGHAQGGNTRTDGEMSDRSLDKERANLRCLLEWAYESEYIEVNPVARLKKSTYVRPEPVFLSAEQYEALIRGTKHDPFLHLYALLLGEAGLRCESEALWLRWEDVHFEDPPHLLVVSGRHVDRSGRLHTTKSKKSRFVPLSERLTRALRAHFEAHYGATYSTGPSPWVFHHVVPRRRAKAGDRIGSLRHSFESAARRANLPAGFTMHDLRHLRCTRWLAQRIPIYSVSQAMGHSSVKVTEYYTHFVKQHLDHFQEAP